MAADTAVVKVMLYESYLLLQILHGTHILSPFCMFPSFCLNDDQHWLILLSFLPVTFATVSATFATVSATWIQMITTAMGVFSVYLLSLLKFKIGYPCPWCLTSVGVTDRNNGGEGRYCLGL